MAGVMERTYYCRLRSHSHSSECMKRSLFIGSLSPDIDYNLLMKSVVLFEVIGAASKDKLDVVTSMGASATIDYNKESIKDKVLYTYVLLIKAF